MTPEQMLAVGLVVAAVVYNYFPQIIDLAINKPPKSDLLADMETVVRIRKTYNSEAVSAASKSLLEALLGIKQ